MSGNMVLQIKSKSEFCFRYYLFICLRFPSQTLKAYISKSCNESNSFQLVILYKTQNIFSGFI